MAIALNDLNIVWQLTLLAAVSAAAGSIVYTSLLYLLKNILRNNKLINTALVKGSVQPLRLLIPLLIASVFLPYVPVDPLSQKIIAHITSILWIISFAWIVIQIPAVLKVYILNILRLDNKDNLKARTIHTQLEVLQKLVIFAVSVLAIALILLNFDRVRTLGASILASAGIIGIIAGFAGQKIFANLLAGIQIAVAQPVRIDDVVIVENEWGWIEDISLTYVVVKLWDLRRLVLPISYFIEKPFQNWTKKNSELIGTVILYADYTLPVEPVRNELHRILGASPLWNKHAWNLQVTNATEHALEIRALLSADDSSILWDLRCEVREKLAAFIVNNYPASLPVQRLNVNGRPPSF